METNDPRAYAPPPFPPSFRLSAVGVSSTGRNEGAGTDHQTVRVIHYSNLRPLPPQTEQSESSPSKRALLHVVNES